MATKPQMLQGYRVLDFTQFVAGPTCTRLLAEMGAEVIKLELAPSGDRVRADGLKSLAPEYKGSTHSTYYMQHNHSKLSFAIDLKKPGAKGLVMSMLPKIDVVVENFAPGVIKRLGFSYEEVKKVNPKIIMCSISMAGQTGPLSDKAGYDLIGQAYAGITDGIGERAGSDRDGDRRRLHRSGGRDGRVRCPFASRTNRRRTVSRRLADRYLLPY